jgi:hypothetical protein
MNTDPKPYPSKILNALNKQRSGQHTLPRNKIATLGGNEHYALRYLFNLKSHEQSY